jgi:hypothetical protein
MVILLIKNLDLSTEKDEKDPEDFFEEILNTGEIICQV